MAPSDWKRITINLEPHLAEIAKQRAKQRRQSVASYFASLLEADVAEHTVAEQQAKYGVSVKPHPEIHSPQKPATAKDSKGKKSA